MYLFIFDLFDKESAWTAQILKLVSFFRFTSFDIKSYYLVMHDSKHCKLVNKFKSYLNLMFVVFLILFSL